MCAETEQKLNGAFDQMPHSSNIELSAGMSICVHVPDNPSHKCIVFYYKLYTIAYIVSAQFLIECLHKLGERTQICVLL